MKFGFWYIVLYLFFLTMAVAALAGGISVLYKTFDLKYNGVYATATITDWRTSSTSLHDRNNGSTVTNDGSSYFPIVTFEINKRKLSVATRSAADNDPVAIGDNVGIVYRKSDPYYVELQQHISGSFIAGGVCLFIGLIFTSIIGIFGYKAWKNRSLKQGTSDQLN
ncbi:MAG: hypothetical protein K0Q95_2491 [Bacteroidota bacterium]|jgi:hypothetical protein|nr:hypothetical protein [Bacteroidota bacterium]